MNSIYKLLTAVVLSGTLSCNKPISDLFTDCPDVKIGSNIESADKFYLAPCFNPENSDEFLYVVYHPNNEVYNKELWKYNMATNEKAFITDNVWYYPKYSLNEWIFFNRYNEQIWKVKSNGDSLQPLFTEELNYDVEASMHNKRIMFRRIIESDYYVMFADYDGNILYQISDKVYADGSWSEDGNKILSTYSFSNEDRGIAIYDTLYNLISKFNHGEYESYYSSIHGMDWLMDSENFVWCKVHGTYKVNSTSGIETQILEGCDTNQYGWPSVSPDNTKILFEHTTLEKIGKNAYRKKVNIVMTDTNGMNEIVIQLE